MTQRIFPPHREWRITHRLVLNPQTGNMEGRTSITIDGKPVQDVAPTWTLTWDATSEVRLDS